MVRLWSSRMLSAMRAVRTGAPRFAWEAGRVTGRPDWSVMGVATSRITTSTRHTSMSGVRLGSVIPGAPRKDRLVRMRASGRLRLRAGVLFERLPQAASVVLGLGQHHAHAAQEVVVE